MDDLDRSIINQLRVDKEISNTSLADKLLVSRQTIITRLNKLVSLGALERTVIKRKRGGYVNVWKVNHDG